MQIRPLRIGPVAMSTTTTTNIFNPPTLSGGTGIANPPANTYAILRHIGIVNRTAGTIYVALWLGATGANATGTEYEFGGLATAGAMNAGSGFAMVPNSFIDRWVYTRMDVADFLVGGASAAGCVITIDGELGVAS